MEIWQIILISDAVIAGIALISFFGYLFFDTYYRRPYFLRAYIWDTDLNFHPLWIRKSEEMKNKFHVATSKGRKWYYNNKDVFTSVGRYSAVMFTSNSFHSLSIGKLKDTLNINAQNAAHPEILSEILDAKLIEEITRKDNTMKDAFMLIGIGLVIIGIVALYYGHMQDHDLLISIQNNVTIGFDMLSQQGRIGR